MIQSVAKKDEGHYQCKAENIADTRETPFVYLGVYGKQN